MPENWKTYKLKDIVDQDRGISYGIVQPGKHDPNGVPILKINNLTGNSFNINDLYFVSKNVEEKYKKTRLRGGELLLSLVGSLGEVFTVPPEMVGYNVVRALAVIPVLNEFSPNWVMYYLRAPSAQNILQQIATTSVQATINLKELREIIIPFPEKIERESIAAILSALDDKIELNLQMNKTLEKVAMALYKHWFVDFGPFQDREFVESELGEIPKGWEVKRLDSLLEIKYGKDHKKLEEGIIPVYGTGGIMRYVNQSLYDQEAILIPRKGSLNNLYYINEPFWTVDTLFYSKIKKSGFGKYVFHFLKTLDLVSMDVGSAVPSLTTQLLNRIDIIVPPNQEVLKFEESANIWFKAIQSNIEENKTLTQLRDTLLPKLISGEVRVKDVEKTLSEVL